MPTHNAQRHIPKQHRQAGEGSQMSLQDRTHARNKNTKRAHQRRTRKHTRKHTPAQDHPRTHSQPPLTPGGHVRRAAATEVQMRTRPEPDADLRTRVRYCISASSPSSAATASARTDDPPLLSVFLLRWPTYPGPCGAGRGCGSTGSLGSDGELLRIRELGGASRAVNWPPRDVAVIGRTGAEPSSSLPRWERRR